MTFKTNAFNLVTTGTSDSFRLIADIVVLANVYIPVILVYKVS